MGEDEHILGISTPLDYDLAKSIGIDHSLKGSPGSDDEAPQGLGIPDAHGQDVPVYPLDELGENLPRTYLDEGGDTGADHKLDRLLPLNTMAELMNKLFLYLVSGGYRLSGGIHHNGDIWVAEGDP